MKSVHGREIGHFSGMYESSEEALLSAPAAMRSTWDDDALVENGIPAFSTIHGFDWPVIDHLRRCLKEQSLKVVTDFGGHVGVKFAAYSRVIDFPDDFSWQVVEVPAVIREAKRRIPADVRTLRFYDRLEETEPCQFLLCSGSLQYAEGTIQQILKRMPQAPQTVLLNKVPVSRKKTFFTVERYIKSLAYRVYGPQELDQCRNRMGYTLTGRWTIPHRNILVLHSKGVERVEMVGECWTLNA